MSTGSDFEDIEIVRIIDEEVDPLPDDGTPIFDLSAIPSAFPRQRPIPRNDATPGSVLCIVPFALSRRPPDEWVRIFLIEWDRPRKFATGKQWPGMASVHGARAVLSRVTLDDVKRHLRDLLESAVAETNKEYRLWEQRQEQRRVQEQSREEEHKRHVRDVAKDIKFD